MRVLCLDFESHYDQKNYSLKSMTQEAYLRDPRFEVLCVAARYLDEDVTNKYGQEQIAGFMERTPWETLAVLCHHSQFDGAILQWKYRVRPKAYLCSLAMARFCLGLHKGASLQAVSELLGLGSKTIDYQSFSGLHWSDMTSEQKQTLAEGCARDVELTCQVYEKLRAGYRIPKSELELIDLTVRMFTEPQLCGDAEALKAVAREENAARVALLDQLDVSDSDLASNDKFSRLLEREGVEIEYKPGKNGPIPALASTDSFIQDLAATDDARVRLLVEGRLAVKSTIYRTRAERLAGMASRGRLPVYLSYFGAHTGRWSGGDGGNLQNLPKDSGIRSAIHAPKGGALVIVDMAQIEARILAYIAGHEELIAAFAEGKDIYKLMASRMFETPIEFVTPEQRQRGKVVTLGAGYGMGAKKFRFFARNSGLLVSDDEARELINGYREANKPITQLWRFLDSALPYLHQDSGSPYEIDQSWGKITPGRLHLPQGVTLVYELAHDGEGGFKMKTRSGWSNLWGGKLTENVVQALARICFSDAMLRIYRRTDAKPALTAHDEVVYVCPAPLAEELREVVIEEMCKPPPELAGLPMKASSAISDRYVKPE